ncbi:MAG: TetR/AcrR family transcriptional regulator [Deltaproteobacteria bacterium]|nr:MAG: TetR/AcrR family transcriptional regulator [Deltaproteobacteria bacterium]
MTRTYDNRRRAERAALTAERIVDSTEALLGSEKEEAVTLKAIAERSGVTVQTVLRHMGSREGCIEAVVARVRDRVEAERGTSEPGDVDAALAGLLTHYESSGVFVLNLLAQESGSSELAREAVVQGRAYHRAWVERCFGPHLDPRGERWDADVDALVAATDLYVWKLLRLDLGRSPEAARAVITRLVRAVLEAPCAPS